VTHHQFDEFLLAVAIICGFGAMLNVSKVSTRGNRAYLLAGAFVTLGASVLLIRLEVAQIWVNLMGAATFGLIAADVALRMKQMPAKTGRGPRK